MCTIDRYYYVIVDIHGNVVFYYEKLYQIQILYLCIELKYVKFEHITCKNMILISHHDCTFHNNVCHDVI